MAVRFDALLDFSYDPRTQDYRYSRGANKGGIMPKAEAMEQVRRFRDAQTDLLVGLADQDLKARDFYRLAKGYLKQIHIAEFLLGVGGYENATDADWLEVGRGLRVQYDKGKGEDGKPFGLKYLSKELPGLSPEMLRHRLRLYAQSGRQVRWLGRTRRADLQGFTHGVRVLGKAEHCADCVAYARMAPRRISTLVLPGQECQCGSNCKCTIRYLTLEEAMGRGGR